MIDSESKATNDVKLKVHSKQALDPYVVKSLNVLYLKLALTRASEDFEYSFLFEYYSFKRSTIVTITICIISLAVLSYLFSIDVLQRYSLIIILAPLGLVTLRILFVKVLFDDPVASILKLLVQELSKPVPYEVEDLSNLHKNCISALLFVFTNSSIINLGTSDNNVSWALMIVSVLCSCFFSILHTWMRIHPRVRSRQLVNRYWHKLADDYNVQAVWDKQLSYLENFFLSCSTSRNNK